MDSTGLSSTPRIPRAWYSASISEFLAAEEELVIGSLTADSSRYSRDRRESEILIFLTPRRQDAKNGGTPDSDLPHAKDAKDGEHTRLACGFRRPAESISVPQSATAQSRLK